MLTDSDKLILLNRSTEIGSAPLRKIIDAFGSLDALWRASVEEIAGQAGIRRTTAERIVSCRNDEAWLKLEKANAASNSASIITLEDPDYPRQLRLLPDPPIVLYVRGRLSLEAPSVALVGSRQASLYGLQCAERLAFDLVQRGVAVVSGLALGIDAAAHRGALKAGGSTIAVLGSGLAQIYPDRHLKLAKEIADKGGTVVSEYPMAALPLAYHFPRRNRIISGLSAGVVVVEARQRSGALITADAALEQGKEVFAVPGPMTAVNSQGTHHLLKQGARLVTGVEDILDELGWVAQQPSEAATGPAKALSQDEQAVLSRIGQNASHIEEIAANSRLAAGTTASCLLQLELKGCIKQLPGGRYIRAEKAALGK